jgi:hypothetical protein
MGEEGEGKVVAACPTHSCSKVVNDLGHVLDGPIGEFLTLDVAPKGLDWVEIRGVSRQVLGGEPGALRPEVRVHGRTPVGLKAIPKQDAPVTRKVPAQMAKERNKGLGVVAILLGLEEELAAPAIPAIGKNGGNGNLGPIEGVDHDGRASLGRPRAAERRLFREAALVLEEEPGAAAPGVFFTRGHSSATQRLISFSLRSFALWAGRWRLQFRERSSFQT